MNWVQATTGIVSLFSHTVTEYGAPDSMYDSNYHHRHGTAYYLAIRSQSMVHQIVCMTVIITTDMVKPISCIQHSATGS